MLSHKAGTRMTLSDRFKLIRQEQQNRKIMVNPLIESPNPDRVMKNYLNTVSDFGRPSAVLRKASERNRKLALQMANNVALMNEFNQRLILPEFPIGTLEMDKILPDVHSRLGLMRNRLNSSLGKGDIKSRLGRRPISQRLGLSQPLKSRMRSVPTNNVQRSRSRKILSKNKSRIGVRQTKKLSNKINTKINRRKVNRLTVESLNQELDVYMSSFGN
ncbi:hypothetical protein SSS_09553 [Sarcoptes scabiei]|uniref:Chromatin target of PRMT1 protein C-terminal domain-containing protein n=1 Tax=Sarcoptes scabiei TaxID=52283 RepID=A0A834VI32_SARSC|nr:hypothetical protein SSS_09553 [Sarcoptes scabiei]UXI17740.1 histone-lysine N-methyltransferase [Sarcoptes scabiei]